MFNEFECWIHAWFDQGERVVDVYLFDEFAQVLLSEFKVCEVRSPPFPVLFADQRLIVDG